MPDPSFTMSFFFLLVLVTACSFNYDTVFQDDEEPNLVMEKVEYIRIVNGNPEIRVKAEKIRRYEAKHTMEMDDFSFEQYNAAPEGQEPIPDVNVWGKAGRARLETDTNNFFMSGDIVIDVASEDISIKTEELSWLDEERSLNAPGMVNISRSNGTILRGTGLSVDIRRRNWVFESAVEGSIIED